MTTDFERRYQEDIDPWHYRDSWYERRKYALTLACLPREKYRLVWEPACSIGVLTRLLATRAERVSAGDASPTAVAEAARDRPANTDFHVRELPYDPGLDGADLVVLSEILYYLDESDREQVLRQARRTLVPQGDLVVVHWAQAAQDTYLSGRQVQAWAREQPGWRHLISHQDEQFVLDVLRAEP